MTDSGEEEIVEDDVSSSAEPEVIAKENKEDSDDKK